MVRLRRLRRTEAIRNMFAMDRPSRDRAADCRRGKKRLDEMAVGAAVRFSR